MRPIALSKVANFIKRLAGRVQLAQALFDNP